VPLVVGGGVMMPAGAMVWGSSHADIQEHGDDARRSMRIGIALTWVGAAIMAGGGAMIAFGKRHRDAAMMSARLRWDLSVAPGLDGARVGVRLRF
jgi:hypothetical protein